LAKTQWQAVFPYRPQVLAPSDDTRFVVGKRELHGELTADRSGTKYRYLHSVSVAPRQRLGEVAAVGAD
jgi:hypothetical protein